MALATTPKSSIYYERIGDGSAPVVVFLAGLGTQSTNYPDEFMAPVLAAGYGVIRLDNRDCGLSSDHAGEPYDLDDMADDVIAVLDAEELESVHLWGSSMGGMIAQLIAIRYPGRLRSLISVQSTTGNPSVGAADPDALVDMVAQSGAAEHRDEAIEKAIGFARALINNDSVFDAEMQRARAEIAYERAYRPDGVSRQIHAVMAASPRDEQLRLLDCPTLVMHGDRDPLIHHSGGEHTASLIPGARFVLIEGMGHDLHPAFWNQYHVELLAHLANAKSMK
jgi:pimeloyl-ACP methyl ester carboxylesterase